MKTTPMKLAALVSLAILAGCSGGGGSGFKLNFSGPPPQQAEDHGCGTAPGYDIQCVPYLPFPGPRMGPTNLPTPLPTFTSWAELQPNTDTVAPALTTALSYRADQNGRVISSQGEQVNPSGHYVVNYDEQGQPLHLDWIGGKPNSHTNLSQAGQAWLDLGRDADVAAGQSPFSSAPASRIALTANPYVLGWNYQSFALWNEQSASPNFASASGIASFGSTTHPSAVPASGTATFAGKLGGFYVSPLGEGSIAAADLTVDADFQTRSLRFASTGTTITRDLATSSPAPNLDLNGTLTYLPGSNTFTGSITNAGGTMTGATYGRFYGPSGQELGGALSLASPTSVETFGGAYGAKTSDAAGATVVPALDAPGSSFRSWTTLPRDANVIVDEVSNLLTYTKSVSSAGPFISSISESRSAALLQAPFAYDQTGTRTVPGTPSGMWPGADRSRTLSAIGHAEIEIGQSLWDPNTYGKQSPFTANATPSLALIASPWKAGWDYQTYGVWDAVETSASAGSFGFATPASAIPATGTANFTGKLVGLYVSPTGQGATAAADLSIAANFSSRSLSFASTGTVTTRDFATKTAAPNLDLSGVLTYSPGSSSFAGALKNAGGTMSGNSKGQFYGPAAQELGGIFTVKAATGVETFTGAYGAKR